MRVLAIPLIAALALGLAAAPAVADDSHTTSWDDPCGDAGAHVTAAGHREPLPTRSGDGLDLRQSSIRLDGDVVTVRLTACGPFDEDTPAYMGIGAALDERCDVELIVQDHVHVLDERTGELLDDGRTTVLSRTCRDEAWLVGTRTPQPAHELPDGSFAIEGDTLTITVDRAALPADIAGVLAPGTRWEKLRAFSAEYGGVLLPSVAVGAQTAFAGRTSAVDTSPGPAELVLD